MIRSHIRQGTMGLVLLTAFIIGTEVGHSEDRTDNSSLVAELNGYVDLIGRTLRPDEVTQMTNALSSKQPEIQALAAALLYRAKPAKYRSALSSQFTIQDYAARAKSETVDISQEQFISRIKEIEQAYPSLHPTAKLLVSFVRLRDANLWFPQGGEKLSASRFLRGAFLAQAFKGSPHDALAVTKELDQEARRQYESGAASNKR